MRIFFLIFVISFYYKCYTQNTKYILVNEFFLKENVKSNAKKIIEDKYGFIWFTTLDGLYQFNGKEYKEFSKSSDNPQSHLLETTIQDFAYDEERDNIIAASSTIGLTIIDVKKSIVKKQIYLNQLIPLKSIFWIKSISIYKNYLYIGLNENKIIQYDLNRNEIIKIFEFNNISVNNGLEKIFCNYDGNLFIAFKGSLIESYNPKTETYQSLIKFPGIQKNAIPNEINLNKKYCIISSDKGILLYNLANKVFDTYKSVEYSQPTNFASFFDDKIIFSNVNGTFIQEQEILFKLIPFKNIDYSLEALNNVLFTKNGIWMASTKGLLYAKSFENTFTPHSYRDYKGNAPKVIYAIHQYNVNDLLFGSPTGLYVLNRDSKTYTTLIKSSIVLGVCSLADNSFIISTSNGLKYLKNNRINNLFEQYSCLKEIDKISFISIVKYKNYILFVSHYQNGFYILNTLTNQLTSYLSIKNAGNLVGTVFKKAVVDDNKLYLISEQNVYSLDIERNELVKIISIENSNISEGIIMDMVLEGDHIVTAIYGIGIVFFDKNGKINKVINKNNGLENNGVYVIKNFKKGKYITSSNNGLFIYNEQIGKCYSYFVKDGLMSNSFEETSFAEIDGKLYFGGIDGFTTFNPNKFNENNAIPKLYFQGISIETTNKKIDTNDIFIKKLIVPNNVLQVKINFIGIRFDNPEKVNYRYRIVELNSNWIDLNSKNEILLLGIEPGKYTLQVKAINSEGIESDTIELKIIFLPKWYQTWWFKTLVVLGIIGLAFLIYKIRVRQIIKEQKIKNALASDLHDELGSTLTGLKVYAYQAKKNPQYIANLEEGIGDSIKQVREMIWQLNEEKLTVHDLINKLAIIYKPLLKLNGTDMTIDIDSNVSGIELLQKEKSHLYLILKEIINNAMKYAQATNFTIKAFKGNKRIAFTLTDNGVGIANHNKGYGLTNMQQRAKEIGYQITCNSSSAGTEYFITK